MENSLKEEKNLVDKIIEDYENQINSLQTENATLRKAMLSKKFIYNLQMNKKNTEIGTLEKEITNKNMAITEKIENKIINQATTNNEIKELEK